MDEPLTDAGASRDVAAQFLSAADHARELLASPLVEANWDAPSALAEYTVAGLAGHLVRAVSTTEQYLSASEPDEPVRATDAAGYFAGVLGDHDPIDSALHAFVRSRSIEASADGHPALIESFDGVCDRLAVMLPSVDPGRLVEVRDGLVLTASAYLETRLVEIVVHLDDLAASVGGEVAVDCDADVLERVIATLALVAARRTDPMAVIRSLSRRERHPDAIRAF